MKFYLKKKNDWRSLQVAYFYQLPLTPNILREVAATVTVLVLTLTTPINFRLDFKKKTGPKV